MHPIIFESAYFTLQTFWLFFGIALITSIYVLIKMAVHNSLKIQFLSENSLNFIFWSIVGARIVAIIFNYQTYFSEFSTQLIRIFYIWDNQLSLWGGCIAFLIIFYKTCKENDQNFWRWLDVIVPAAILGIAIGDIGAFFGGINYGHESSLPWSVNFESPAIKYSVPIHPTQIYAFLYSMVIFYTLNYAKHLNKIKEIEPKGFIGLGGIFLYALLRTLEDFVRGDDVIMIFDIRLTLIISAIITILTGIFIYLRYNKRAENFRNKISSKKWKF